MHESNPTMLNKSTINELNKYNFSQGWQFNVYDNFSRKKTNEDLHK